MERSCRQLLVPVAICFFCVLYVSLAHGAASSLETKCNKEARPDLGFEPKAFTLTAVNVRDRQPEYSIIKGKWVLGQIIDTLPSSTCITVQKKENIGVFQIWYLIKYRKEIKRDSKVLSGWVWGGTIGVDDRRYIGGDTTPPRQQGTRLMIEPPEEPAGFSFVNIAYAQADISPVDMGGSEYLVGGADYYVRIPLVGWPVNFSILSAVLLFSFMTVGMFAKAVWDQTEGGKLNPPLVKIIRPLLISPIAFSSFWGTMYLQQGSAGFSITSALYAFQIGFMWQHVLEKRLPKQAGERL